MYVKTAERQHMPSKLWEVIPLDKNLETAFKQIDNELIYWPSFSIHKCKQRLVKITQYLIRMRRLRKQPEYVKLLVLQTASWKVVPEIEGTEKEKLW